MQLLLSGSRSLRHLYPRAAQGNSWARSGADAIAALVDLGAAEVRELLSAADDAGSLSEGSTALLAERVARLLARLEGALAGGSGPLVCFTSALVNH